MNLHVFTRFYSLCAARDEGKAIRLYQRGNDSRTACQRRGKDLVPYFTNGDSHKIIITRRRNNLTRQGCRKSWQFVRSSAQPGGDQWLDK